MCLTAPIIYICIFFAYINHFINYGILQDYYLLTTITDSYVIIHARLYGKKYPWPGYVTACCQGILLRWRRLQYQHQEVQRAQYNLHNIEPHRLQSEEKEDQIDTIISSSNKNNNNQDNNRAGCTDVSSNSNNVDLEYVGLATILKEGKEKQNEMSGVQGESDGSNHIVGNCTSHRSTCIGHQTVSSYISDEENEKYDIEACYEINQVSDVAVIIEDSENSSSNNRYKGIGSVRATHSYYYQSRKTSASSISTEV